MKETQNPSLVSAVYTQYAHGVHSAQGVHVMHGLKIRATKFWKDQFDCDLGALKVLLRSRQDCQIRFLGGNHGKFTLTVTKK